ncbi:hypothetical protein [Paenibacillus dakarensis]|uniref:hypothetical protein n=1 Tax=Paenibacillus dakarensis TaxID=1527293 RepID=UPI0006D58091|nr:hypothetical protein [Paenibacillus dakarensis]
MAEQPHGQATFYQYQLLKKITLSKHLIGLYLILPCAAVASEMLLLSWDSFIYFLIAFALILWIHFVIGRSVLFIHGSVYPRKWRFSLKTPWLGYMPDQHVSFRIFRIVQFHTSWISLCLFVIMAFWSPLAFIISLLFWHIWLLVPRYFALVGCKNQHKGGMLKFSEQDISYYKQ